MNVWVRNEDKYQDKSPIFNNIFIEDRVDLNDWHSFCMSVNLDTEEAKLVQNGKMVAVMPFKVINDFMDEMRELMDVAFLGAFTGSITDIQIYSKPLEDEDMIAWTLCKGNSMVQFCCVYCSILRKC